MHYFLLLCVLLTSCWCLSLGWSNCASESGQKYSNQLHPRMISLVSLTFYQHLHNVVCITCIQRIHQIQTSFSKILLFWTWLRLLLQQFSLPQYEFDVISTCLYLNISFISVLRYCTHLVYHSAGIRITPYLWSSWISKHWLGYDTQFGYQFIHLASPVKVTNACWMYNFAVFLCTVVIIDSLGELWETFNVATIVSNKYFQLLGSQVINVNSNRCKQNI